MKKTYLICTLILLCSLVACEKSSDKDFKAEKLRALQADKLVVINDCINQEFDNEEVTICLEEVINDSRCPADAVCVWQGSAIARFTFKEGGRSHALVLATHPFDTYRKDTTIAGYTIRFDTLYPYPGTGDTDPASAEVTISR